MWNSTTKRALVEALLEAERNLLAGISNSSVDTFKLRLQQTYERTKELFQTKCGGDLVESLQSIHIESVRFLGSDDALALEMVVGCRGMAHSVGNLDSLLITEEVKELIVDRFECSLNAIKTEEWSDLSTVNDPTMRFLRCCFLQWIPVGMYYFEYSGIPKRNILLCPVRRRPALLRFLVFRMKGLSPTIEMHLPAQSRCHFTEEESNRSHRLVAGVLGEQPAIKGISGSSWYCDPEALRISPHLSFVRELFEKNGGFLHRLGPTNDRHRKALLKSRTRRRLFEEGKYEPMDYARYWARKDVMSWAGIRRNP